MELLDIAREESVSLIVIGAYGLGKINDSLVGSTAARVVRFAPCDVLIVRSPMSPGGGIIVGIDGSNEAEAANAYIVK